MLFWTRAVSRNPDISTDLEQQMMDLIALRRALCRVIASRKSPKANRRRVDPGPARRAQEHFPGSVASRSNLADVS